MISAIPAMKDRWTGVTSKEMGAFGGWISGIFLHWDDTITHAASKTAIVHAYSLLPSLNINRPYCINMTHLMGLILESLGHL